MKKKNKSSNYDFSSQKQPKKPLGDGDYANMPEKPIYKTFGSYSYQDGIIDSFVDSVEKMSGIVENQR